MMVAERKCPPCLDTSKCFSLGRGERSYTALLNLLLVTACGAAPYVIQYGPVSAVEHSLFLRVFMDPLSMHPL